MLIFFIFLSKSSNEWPENRTCTAKHVQKNPVRNSCQNDWNDWKNNSKNLSMLSEFCCFRLPMKAFSGNFSSIKVSKWKINFFILLSLSLLLCLFLSPSYYFFSTIQSSSSSIHVWCIEKNERKTSFEM